MFPDSEPIMAIPSRRFCFRAPSIEASMFHSLWLPFLGALAEFCEANSIPTSSPDYRQIFAAILTAYFETYVGEEPIKNGSLAWPFVRCDCKDCTRLNKFLADPDRTVARYPMRDSRRQHLHMSLDVARIDCTHQTERIGPPYTLVVTKKFPHHATDITEWKKRKAEAPIKLNCFSKSDLTVWLGKDYDRLMKMVDPESSSGLSARTMPQPQSLAPIPPNQQTRKNPPMPQPTSIAGRKRKATDTDVVDLTGDDW